MRKPEIWSGVEGDSTFLEPTDLTILRFVGDLSGEQDS